MRRLRNQMQTMRWKKERKFQNQGNRRPHRLHLTPRTASDRFVELVKTLTGICSKTGNGKKFLPVTHLVPTEVVHRPVDVVGTETETEKVPEVEARVIVGAVVIAHAKIVLRLNNATVRPVGPLYQTDHRQQTGQRHQKGQLPTIAFASNDHNPKIDHVQLSVLQLARHVAAHQKVPEIVVDRRVMTAVDKRDLATRSRVMTDRARTRNRQQALVPL